MKKDSLWSMMVIFLVNTQHWRKMLNLPNSVAVQEVDLLNILGEPSCTFNLYSDHESRLVS